MKKVIKLIAVLAIVLILVTIGIAALAITQADKFAKQAIERGGTYALGVDTTLGSAKIGLIGGTFAMNNLKVANPEKFTTPHFLSLGDGGVAVNYKTLREDTIVLPHLKLSGLDMNLEKASGTSNYQVILDNLKKFESKGGGASQSGAGEQPGFIISEVEITNVVVHVDVLPVGGEATRLNVPIDAIKLTNVGSTTDKKILLADLMGVIIKAVFAALIEKGGSIIPSDVLGDLNSQLAQLSSLGEMGVGVAIDVGGQFTNVVGGVAGQLGEGAGKAVEGAGKALEDATKGIGGLFGGDKDKEKDKN